MYKHLYTRFLNAHPNEYHFACHSHHYWPDVSRDAHLQYWDDSCQYVDDKWAHIFSKKIPLAQKLIAENLGLSHPEQIVFAPNTHELVFRLLSSLDWNKKIRILTTDSEFYSFDRQINRLSEFANFEVVKISTQPFASFNERFAAAMDLGKFDLIFLSHVFFNSGVVCDVEKLANKAPADTMFVIDGYHSFMAIPVDLSNIQDKAFYVAGSYKYAQGGEGACFLYVPPATRHRPFHTGWFAELSHLSAVGNQVGYPADALQYAGSTMDFSALYRLIAVLEKFKSENLSPEKIHAVIQKNQALFLELLKKKSPKTVSADKLLTNSLDLHGHFLTFDLGSTEITQKAVKDLQQVGIKTDSRGSRLRFGFGLYHDDQDIDKVTDLVSKI
ncbi:aminotransferase class V-fold PLP-dependent enzyme [Bdellovibrio bacteriovorus]